MINMLKLPEDPILLEKPILEFYRHKLDLFGAFREANIFVFPQDHYQINETSLATNL